MEKSSLSPYQPLFLLGTIQAVVGVALWILMVYGQVEYPAVFHANLMITGFLFSFATGFLMTAVPRFTGSFQASFQEIVIACVLSISSFFLEGSGLFSLGFLAVFFLRRMRSRQYDPPPFFIFIPLGLMLGLAGSALLLFYPGNPLGKAWLYQGVMLSFVVGIGAKLVTVLLGYEPSPLVQIESLKASKRKAPGIPPITWVVFSLIGGSFILEAIPDASTFAHALRALGTSIVGFKIWKLYRLPPQRGYLSWGIWFSSWSFVLGLWLSTFFPMYRVHFQHIFFISGFAMLTLLLGARVILSHGGYDVDIEVRSKAILFTWVLLLLAQVTRVSAIFLGEGYVRHLAYASFAFIVGIGIWAYALLPRLKMKPSNQ